MLDKAQAFAPKLSSRRLEDGTMVSADLEDMAPFLPRDEFALAMKIPEQVA
jgi:acetolactate synthase-1/2/3 large subunit